MKTQEVDTDWNHLFPEFRLQLKAVFEEAAKEGLILSMVEGYRSNARQEQLFAQGRRNEPKFRPGKIVTYSRVPKWHGAGLAADSYPTVHGKLTYNFSNVDIQIYHALMLKHSLQTSGMPGDDGHAQLNTDESTRLKALHWVQNGFQDYAVNNITIEMNGKEIIDAHAAMEREGHVSARLRPILDVLGARIISVLADIAHVKWNCVNYSLPITIKESHAIFEVSELRKLAGIEVVWNPTARKMIVKSTVTIQQDDTPQSNTV